MAFLFSFLVACSAFADSLSGLYTINGNDSDHGAYQGFVQIKGAQAIRIIRYRDYYFMGHQVETVWDGRIQGDIVQFKLKPSDSMTGFNGYKISAEQMQNPVLIEQRVDVSQPIQLLNSKETWTLFSDDPGSTPLWKNLRTRVAINGGKASWLIKVAKLIGLKKVIETYHELAAKSPWGHRPEFLNKEHWAIVDHTDYDFYQGNPHILRVTNKTLNPVSLAEATARKNAYDKKLSEKARFFEDETKKYNLNPSGLLEIAVVDAHKNKVSSEVDYDSTLWTGIYIWSQVLRYKQTHATEAYENIKAALKGMLILTEITGNPNQFARTVIESPSSEKTSREGLVQGTGRYAHLKWQRFGNNDMTKGLFISFITSYSVLKKEDAALMNQIAEATKRLVHYDPIKERGFNLGIAYGLVALYNRDVEALQTYSKYINNVTAVASDALNLDSGFYYGSIADWSGIHLSMISAMSDLLLARELQDAFSYNEGDYLARRARKQAEDRLFEMSETYRDARRDFLTLMAYAYSPKARTSQTFKKRAQEAIWTLRDMPAPRFIGYGEMDHTLDPNWSISAWPSLPWKSMKGPFRLNKEHLTFDYHMQGAYMFPIFETTAWTSTYLWKDSPYRTKDFGRSNKVVFSTDYLLIYRIAVSAGLISPQE